MNRNAVVFLVALVIGAAVALVVRAALRGPAAADRASVPAAAAPAVTPASTPAVPAPATTPSAPKPVNTVCPVMGNAVEPIGGTVTWQGNLVGFCCPGCVDAFHKDPARFGAAALRNEKAGPPAPPAPAAAPAAPASTTPAGAAPSAPKPVNTVCPVMGGAVEPGGTVTWQGHVVGFCCPGCAATFHKDPARYGAAALRNEKAAP